MASSLALRFNHISNSRGRIRWLKAQLGLPVDEVSAEAATNGDRTSDTTTPSAVPHSNLPEQSSGGGRAIEVASGATRVQNLEKIHDTVEQALEQLAAALEAGKSETLKAWLKTMGRFHDYSLGNQMLIAWQKPDATHVAGFHAWKKFNRLVNKGEKGIMILAPVTKVVGKLQEQDVSGNTSETPIRKLVNTKVVYVFDISQTHGEPLPELADVSGDPDIYTSKLKAFIEEKGIELYSAPRLSMGAQGLSEGGRIGVQQGLTPAEEFRTLAHELAHELLHRGERRKETTKRSRELEAESVAFVVCSAIGLDARQTSTDYIQLYRGDKAALLESLQFIRSVSQEILAAIAPETCRNHEVHA